MAKYHVELIEPGRTKLMTGSGKEYTEKELRRASESLPGRLVVSKRKNTGIRDTVGQVLHSEYNNGVECTVEISDEETIYKLDEGLVKIAPVMLFGTGNGVEFQKLSVVAQADDLVGETERVEEEWLYGWEHE